jgi:hypothetical protein
MTDAAPTPQTITEQVEQIIRETQNTALASEWATIAAQRVIKAVYDALTQEQAA